MTSKHAAELSCKIRQVRHVLKHYHHLLNYSGLPNICQLEATKALDCQDDCGRALFETLPASGA